MSDEKTQRSSNGWQILASDAEALCAALRERDATIAKLEAAARAVVNIGWSHGDDCPHRNCDDPDNCEDGYTIDGCENPGTKCDCGMSVIRPLAALLPLVPPVSS